MKHKNNIRLLFAMVLVCFALQISAKTTLRLNLQKGSGYEMNMNMSMKMDQEVMGQQIKMDQKMNMQLIYKVADILPSKNYIIEYSVGQVKLDMNANGQQVSFDSQAGGNPTFDKLKAIIGSVVKMEVTPLGKIEKIEGMDAFIQKLGDDKTMAQLVPMFSSDEGIKSFMNQTFGYIPENELEKGSKWSCKSQLTNPINLDLTVNYELASIEGNALNLNVTSTFNAAKQMEQMGAKVDMQIDGTQNGTMTVDATDGWLRAQNLDQNIKMIMKMKNPQSGEEMNMPIELKMNIETRVVKKSL
ncbi:DUF6263 family protein [Paludibacter jiangxiensis]|uniref:DUF4412 domain-containing protein n=1 Tax=Paludibacter jiangxiensis TaxID=681398 RepID=A0A161LDR8_9BACT|nr:DUF6263 family protein [Paludibacter jiangxiensis]GAT62455.1 hypothetical protein PJIAN_214 [Paludibacter jiangxiensis]